MDDITIEVPKPSSSNEKQGETPRSPSSTQLNKATSRGNLQFVVTGQQRKLTRATNSVLGGLKPDTDVEMKRLTKDDDDEEVVYEDPVFGNR